MKKNNFFKTVGVAIFFAAVFGFVSCNNGNNSNNSNKATGEDDQAEAGDAYVEMTTGFQTYYLNIADADLGGLEGFHLKNLNTDKKVGIIIDKIFASDSMSEENAVAVFNFDDPETGTKYWGFDGGTIANGEWSSGEIAAATAPAEAPEAYITGFATSVFVDHVYVGIVAKNLSEEVKGDDISLIPIIGDPKTDKAITFRAFTKK